MVSKARLSSFRDQHNGIIQQEREMGIELRVQRAHVGIYNQAARWGQWKEILGRSMRGKEFSSDHLNRNLLGDKIQRLERPQGRGIFFKQISSILTQTGFYRLDRELEV